VAAPLAGAGGAQDDHPYAIVAVSDDADAIVAAVVAARADVVYWRFNRNGLRRVVRRLGAIGVPVVLAVSHEDDLRRWTVRPWPAHAHLRDHAAELRARLRSLWQHGALRRVAAVVQQRADLAGRVRTRREVVIANARPLPTGVVPLDRPRPFVAWVGNLKPAKRPELARVIADALAPHGIDVVMAGALADPAYAALTVADPAHPNLHHVGALAPDEVDRLIAGARCFALTCVPEGFPNVLLQAWSLGVATVSFEVDPDGLIAREGLGACADGDLERFLAGVVRHATDAELSVDIGARARAVVAARFDPERAHDALEALLIEVAAAGA
jgi:glycosyltransferase involved in cell wall biosynthesis